MHQSWETDGNEDDFNERHCIRHFLSVSQTRPMSLLVDGGRETAESRNFFLKSIL